MRDSTFDVMKGIGIIAMIIGHSHVPMVIKDFIFAWHMPLFFIVSGYFYKPSQIKEHVKKNFRSLVVPYLVTAILMFLLCLLKNSFHETNIINPLLGIVVASGSKGLPMLGDYYVGAIWFLLALFWCRITYNIINQKISQPLQGIVILSVAILSTYIATKIYIPTNLLQGISAMVFFYIGNLFRKRDLFHVQLNWLILAIGILAMIATMTTSEDDYPMSMVRCYYGYYPVNVIASCFCTYFIYRFILYMGENISSKILSLLGSLSMLILCIHIIDLNFDCWYNFNKVFLHLEGGFNKLVSLIWHLTFAILLSVFLAKNKVVRSIFGLK